MRSMNARINDAILKAKAADIRDSLGINKEEFKCSDGWLQKFKQRWNIRLIYLHGEANSADEAGVQLAREVRTHMQRLYLVFS